MTSSAAGDVLERPVPRTGNTRWFVRLGRSVVRTCQISRCRTALASLSDATLKDIGINRSEIDYFAEAIVNDRRDPRRLPPSLWG